MRDPHDLHLLTCAGMALNTHEVHPERAELLLGAAGAAAAGSPAAWCCEAPRRRLVLARWRAARDEYFASGNDPGHYQHLHSTNVIVV